jgi:hypothetical protein
MMTVSCPRCRRTLDVAGATADALACCPACQHEFRARPSPAAIQTRQGRVVDPPLAELADEPEAPRACERGRSRRRLDGQLTPHRGPILLGMGVASFVVAPLILGPATWIMAHNDLHEMDAGRMDTAGRDQTRIGRLCGMLSTLLCTLVLFSLCGRLVFLVARSNIALRGASQGGTGQQKAEVGPNDPDPNEGPAPRGWTVLFRSDNPGNWNTSRSGKDFALPVRKAHSTIRYLRLKRMDTGERLIVPITHKQLAGSERPASSPGHWWNGTARDEWGGRHLGIVQVPAAASDQRGLVGLALDGDAAYSGSGFGWKTHIDDRQCYCWQGKEIPRTAFEVAVTAGPLSEAEKRWLTVADTNEPAQKGWTVLFRSDDPSVWNTFSSGDNFSMPVGRAHRKVRNLRLKRMDTGEMVILAVSRADLAREPKQRPDQGFAWNGSARLQYGARHLGIARAPRYRWPKLDGVFSIVDEGFDAFSGWGFGHKCNVGDRQYYCWQGKEVPKTAFEVAVKVQRLSAEERRWRVR